VEVIDKIKTLLGLKDNDQDPLLNVIIENTEQALCFKLSVDEVPKELDYVLVEVAIKRFNRLKNEGMTSYSQEGESITFNSSDFDDFNSDIQQWRADNNKNERSLGKVHFINPYEVRVR
jgi:hypothetical protein